MGRASKATYYVAVAGGVAGYGGGFHIQAHGQLPLRRSKRAACPKEQQKNTSKTEMHNGEGNKWNQVCPKGNVNPTPALSAPATSLCHGPCKGTAFAIAMIKYA
ncbi:hypothetical protein GCM10027048_36740 [Hymenobacter coalescens]